MNDTTGGAVQTESQKADIIGTFSAPLHTLFVLPHPASSKSTPSGYVLIYQSNLNEIMSNLGIVKAKVQLMKGRVKLLVEN